MLRHLMLHLLCLPLNHHSSPIIFIMPILKHYLNACINYPCSLHLQAVQILI